MFKIGDTVVYGTEGVCTVTDISKNDFSNMETERLYYILTPKSHNGGKIYVPCDNELLVSRMKNIMTKSEIKKIIKDDSIIPQWIDDNRQRNRVFKDIIATYDRKQIFGLAKLLCKVKKDSNGKRRLYASDEEILKKLLFIIFSELSLVIEIEYENVSDIILGEKSI